jgi:hypothetical protein
MRRVVGILACVLVMLLLHLASPNWWWVMAIPLLYGALHARSGPEGFLVGAASAGIVWGVGCVAAYAQGGDRIARRIAEMLLVGNPWLLIAGTTVLAMLAAGLAAATGHRLRSMRGKEPV